MKRWLLLLVPSVLVCALAMGVDRIGIATPIDRVIVENRMKLSPQEPSGNVVFIAVDARSLREVGIWPWPRQIHAELLDRLTEAGAQDVLFDVDFSFAGDEADDQAFEDALERAGGTTYLPVFAQSEDVSTDDNTVNFPLARFAERSWPALTNVAVDPDGILRDYLYGLTIEEASIPSVGSLISGTFGEDGASFPINFAINPAGLPTYSYIDVLSGAVPGSAFTGKSVIIGAYALELRDTFAVPVHGILPGPLVHALAGETLISGNVPRMFSAVVVMPLLFIIILLIHLQSRHSQALTMLRTTILLMVIIEAGAFMLFQKTSFILPTGVLYPSVLLYGTWRMSHMLGLNRFLVEVKQAQLDNTFDILGQVFADSSDAILVIDSHGEILHHSKMSERVFGCTAEGYPLLPDKLDWAVAGAIAAYEGDRWQPEGTQEITVETRGRKRHIEYTITPSAVHDSLKSTVSYIATISARDVTEARLQAERIDYLSSHDERTGALRRTAFFAQLSRVSRKGMKVAVFAINLHRFKTINVTLGREVGDQVLRQCVVRLQNHPAGFGQVMRLDGDSFAVFLTNIDDIKSARDTARDIVRALTRPFALKDSRAQVGVRVGFAMDALSRDITGPVLLDRAEEALDLARSKAGNRIAGYDLEIGRTHIRARAIEQAMTGAIGREEFSMLYQPQVNMSDGQLCGVEALVRWDHPDLGRIGPDEFIPIAESNGFIQELGRWVLLRSMREGMLLPPHVSLAVNVSPIQMMSSRIVQDVEQALEETGFQPDRLWLEITESTMLTPNAHMLGAMDRIEQLGAAWALDDFGTGFSSLNYMATLPIRKLKVDRAFVSTLESDASALAIIRSVQVMCDGLGIKMLCEGIETKAQAKILRDEKCAEGQGYLYGRPMKMAEVLSRFARTRRIAS